MTTSLCPTLQWSWKRVRSANTRRSRQALEYEGKWILFVGCAYVHPIWRAIVSDVRGGMLGPEAKVSIHGRPDLNARHAICVSTTCYSDQEDILRVARRLVTTASLKKMTLVYKAECQSRAGVYCGTGDRGDVALYTFAPPYTDLKRGGGWDHLAMIQHQQTCDSQILGI